MVEYDGEEVDSSVLEISTENMRALASDPFKGEVIQTEALDMGDYLMVDFLLDTGYKVKLKIRKDLKN